MCRVFGISYGNGEREELDAAEIAAILYPALVHQGKHAWGWMTSDGTDIVHQKFPGRADSKESYGIQIEEIDPEPVWMVGHVRWATHGAPEDNRNNHPIPHGKIIGVHNGVLRNHDFILGLTGREDPKTIVDSEAIFAAVNKWGPVKGLKKIKGDMVAIYANRTKPNVLHLARSHGRQVTLGWTEKGNLIFASEEQALRKLEPEIKFTKFSTVSENRLLIIRAGKIIQRHRYAPVTPRYVAPPATRTVQRATTADAFSGTRAASVAQRRGEKLFPRTTEDRREERRIKSQTARNRPVLVPTEIVNGDGQPPRPAPNQNRKLYYYEGQLLTHDEYMEAIDWNDAFGPS